MQIRIKYYSKYIFLGFLLLFLILTFMIIRSFLLDIITAAIISYIFYPVYKFLENKTGQKNLSAVIISILVILVITLPLIFTINMLTKEVYTSYIFAREAISETVDLDCATTNSLICTISNSVRGITSDAELADIMYQSLERGLLFIINAASSFIISIPSKLFDLFVIVFLMFFMFRDGKEILSNFWSILPLKKLHQERLSKRFSDITYAVVFGQIITALVQGSLAAIGFAIFGIKSPLLWGLLTAFITMIPFMGAFLIWLPASVYLLSDGFFAKDYMMVGRGVGLFLYGFFIISMVDNILKPKIIGKRGGIHPAIALLGIIGGLKFAGIIGIIFGPLVLALFITLLDMYKKENL